MHYQLIILLTLLPFIVNAGAFEDAEKLRASGDHQAALILYKEAASQAHPIANHWVGTYYKEGISVDKDSRIAAIYFLPAAALGVDGSMVYLANIYISGDGLPKDCEAAEYWILKATNGNLPNEWKEKLGNCE